MRILHTVESYLPLRHGMQEAVTQISERLVKRGHEVVIATSYSPDRKGPFINGVRVEQFALSGNMVKGYGGETAEQDRYQRFLLQGSFDVITNFAAQQWATDLALSILAEIPAKKVLVPTGFSGLYSHVYRDYFERMPAWMRQYEANVFLSETYRDALFAKRNNIKNQVLIPNGAAEEEFLASYPISIREKLEIDRKAFVLLLVGSHTGLKGHKEAVAIFDKAQIENAFLLIVTNHVQSAIISPGSWQEKMFAGFKTAQHIIKNECPHFCRTAEAKYGRRKKWRTTGKSLRYAELSRQETVCAYQEADLFILPSRVECSPIVLFEALASKTPFLATDVGNAAEIVQWTGGGKILPTTTDDHGYAYADIRASARMLEDVWHDVDGRMSMAEAGHAAWRKRFTWEKVAEQYERLYVTITQQAMN